MSARDELDELRQRVWVLEQKIAKLEAREAPTATHRRPSSGAMRLDLESAKTEPAPPTEAGEAFAEATRKLGG